jgi:hypothetical protein
LFARNRARLSFLPAFAISAVGTTNPVGREFSTFAERWQMLLAKIFEVADDPRLALHEGRA